MGRDRPAKDPPAAGFTSRDAERVAYALGMEAERLRAVDAHRRHLLHEMDRDLRAAITPVLLELHVLDAHAAALPPAAQRALQVVRRNVQRWAAKTERVLAAVEEGGQRPERVDLAALVADVARSFATRALQDGVRLHGVAPPSPLAVVAPLAPLRQAVAVLLDQALASTPAGGDVTVTTRHLDGRAVLEVQDGGPGMTAEDLGPLEDPARWTEAGRDWAMPLLRTALLAESLGGKLLLESDGTGLGMCRTLSLPAATEVAPGPVFAQPVAHPDGAEAGAV